MKGRRGQKADEKGKGPEKENQKHDRQWMPQRGNSTRRNQFTTYKAGESSQEGERGAWNGLVGRETAERDFGRGSRPPLGVREFQTAVVSRATSKARITVLLYELQSDLQLLQTCRAQP